MIPKGNAPSTVSSIKCPITGRELKKNLINGYLQPAEKYSASENPEGLNRRIERAGFNPNAYYEFDGAISILAYILDNGNRIARVEPSRDRGRFGGWQVVPEDVEMNGILANWDMPNERYEIEWLV